MSDTHLWEVKVEGTEVTIENPVFPSKATIYSPYNFSARIVNGGTMAYFNIAVYKGANKIGATDSGWFILDNGQNFDYAASMVFGEDITLPPDAHNWVFSDLKLVVKVGAIPFDPNAIIGATYDILAVTAEGVIGHINMSASRFETGPFQPGGYEVVCNPIVVVNDGNILGDGINFKIFEYPDDPTNERMLTEGKFANVGPYGGSYSGYLSVSIPSDPGSIPLCPGSQLRCWPLGIKIWGNEPEPAWGTLGTFVWGYGIETSIVPILIIAGIMGIPLYYLLKK